MKKKLLSLLLAVIMVLSMLPTAVFADETDNTAPTVTSVLPAEGAVTLDSDESFVLTVTASDDTALYELEIDHSMESTLPEFSVYADSTNPYGTAEDKAAFEAQGASVTYAGGVWTIDFGETATDLIAANGGITFYLVVKDTAGNAWGSMSPTTDENTFAYSVAAAPKKPVFSTDLSTTEVRYETDAAASALEVAANVTDGGAVTYQWYSNTVNNAGGGTLLTGETGTSYTPSTAAEGTTYYYVVAANTIGENTTTAVSSVAAVTVTKAGVVYNVKVYAVPSDLTFHDGAEQEVTASVSTEDGYTVYSMQLAGGTYSYSSETYGTGIIKIAQDDDIYLRAIYYEFEVTADCDYSIRVVNTEDEDLVYTSATVSGRRNLLIPALGYGVTYRYAVLPENDTYCGFESDLWVEPGTAEFEGFKTTSYNLSDGAQYTIGEKKTITFYVPEGADISVCQLVKFFRPVNEFAVEYQGNSNGADIYKAEVGVSGSQYAGNFYYRVEKDGYVTTAVVFDPDDVSEITVSELTPDAQQQLPEQIYEADLLMNGNNSKHIKLEIGEVFDIWTSRAWQATNSITSNRYVEPDYHYTVLDGDSVTVDDIGIVRAVKEGVSVVAVTYDALKYQGTIYSAIFDENVGIYVVTVGGSNEGIHTGISLSDLDTLYFAETVTMDGVGVVQTGDHTEYTFTPTDDLSGEIQVSVRTANGYPVTSLTNWVDYTANEDGSFTVNIYAGRNIIRIKAGDREAYHVVHGMGTTVNIENVSAPGALPKGSETVAVSLTNLETPIPKLGAIYNPGYGGTIYLEYSLSGGGTSETVLSDSTQYNIRDPETATMKITMPDEGIYTLSGGRIHAGSYGSSPGTHLFLRRQSGEGSYTDGEMSPEISGYYGSLPDLSISVAASDHEETANAIIALIQSIGTVTYDDACWARISAARDAYDSAIDEVRVYISDEVYKVLTDAEKAYHAIDEARVEQTIEKTTIGGQSYYVLTNKEQLVWFQKLVNGTLGETERNGAANAVLGSDIVLNEAVLGEDYALQESATPEEWTPIGQSKDNPYIGTFDGAGYSISGLYLDASAQYQGLFGYLKLASIKNLTVRDAYIKNTAEDTGGIAGYAESSSFTNCVFNGALTATTKKLGGICGESEGSTVQLCTFEGTISGTNSGGGMVGYITTAKSLVQNCSASATITGTNGMGGIVGYMLASDTAIRDCYASGTVTGTNTLGGICGYLKSGKESITNCYSTVTVNSEGTSTGGIVGSNGGTVSNCYYLEGSAARGGASTTAEQAIVKTQAQFAGGEVAYLLGTSFGQTLGTDNYPVFYDGENGVFLYEGSYTNSCSVDSVIALISDGIDADYAKTAKAQKAYDSLTEAEKAQVTNADVLNAATAAYDTAVSALIGQIDGLYPITNESEAAIQAASDSCAAYTAKNGDLSRITNYSYLQSASLRMSFLNETAIENSIEIRKVSGVSYYVLTNADQLIWFQKLVNGTLSSRSLCNSANAVLGNDITLNENVLNSAYELNTENSETFTSWVPLASDYKDGTLYKGIFDGAGYTISGIYYNDSTKKNVGFFKYLGGTVKDLTLKDAYICGKEGVGGIVSNAITTGTVENCRFDGRIEGASKLGGICAMIAGTATDIHIENCIASGVVSGTSTYLGGILGQFQPNIAVPTAVANCYSTMTVVGTADYRGAICGAVPPTGCTVTNCYYLDSVGVMGLNNGDVAGSAESRSAAQFASGEVAYLLGSAFGQELGTDAYPVFADGNNQVYNHGTLYANSMSALTEAMIDAIGTVTLDSGTAIEEAREAYDALTEDQKALVTNYTILTAAEERLAVLVSNTAPALKSGVEATASANTAVGAAYTLDLTTIFEDADSDPLTYTVKIGEADPIAADAAYSYTPASTGTYTLVFTANDGKADSAAYTVTLINNTAPALKAGVSPDTDAFFAKVGDAWELDLTKIFEDADSDPLTYTVKIGEADPIAADAAYSYTPTEENIWSLVFTANDGTSDSPTYTVTLIGTYCFTITNNVEWAADSTSTTLPYLLLPSSFDDIGSIVYDSAYTFRVSNYANLTSGLMLESVEIDGLVIPLSEFAKYTSLTAIDTSSCTHLGGRTVQIRMNKGNPQFKFVGSTGSVTGNIEINFVFSTPSHTPSVTVAEGDTKKGTASASFAEEGENGSLWAVTAVSSNTDLYYFDYVEDASGNKTYSTNGEPVTIEVTADSAAYTAHFSDVTPNFTPTVSSSNTAKGTVEAVFVKNTGTASSTWTVTATPATWYELSYVESASGSKTYSEDGTTATLTVAANESYTAYFTAAVDPVCDESDAGSVTVSVTISNDGRPIMGNDADSTVLSHLEVTVPYFDLSLYGLSNFYRYGTEEGFGSYVNENLIHRPTALHLYIYLLERYYMGLPEDQCGKGTSGLLDYNSKVDVKYMDGATAYNSNRKNALLITGSPTSLYMSNFWGHDENLMYYINHAYPLMAPGWGSTCDYILLSDDDTVDVAMFTDWTFYTRGAFTCFSQDQYTILAGETVTTQTWKSGTQEVTDGSTAGLDAITDLTVSVYDSDWDLVTTLTGTENTYSYTFETPGTYYLLGQDSIAGSSTACYAPATTKVLVGSSGAPEQDEDGYYLLDDAFDMLWFEKYVNTDGNYGIKAALTADIDMTDIPWSGIGTCTNASGGTGVPFTGEFDGRGHTLTVAFTESALFNCVSGTVKNLTVDGSVSVTGYASGIISMLLDDGAVDNCVNKASVDCAEAMMDKTDYAGGVVWAAFGDATITDCANYGDINGGRYYNGGIIGYVRATEYTVTISGCDNYADLNVDGRCAGGIVGDFTCNNGEVTDCANCGDITAASYAGGVIGELASDSATISDCANYGDVVGTGSYAGGITAKLGYFQCLIDGCSNAGAVTGKAYAGGIAGLSYGEVTNCYNTGAITVTGDQSSYSAGGISGTQAKCQIYNTWTYTGGKISNCYTTGTVTRANESSTIGAVVGILSSTKNCTAYYLEGTCASGVGSISEDGTTDSTQAKTSEELKALAATLGDAFIKDWTNLNGGYPILAWQAPAHVNTAPVLKSGISSTATAFGATGNAWGLDLATIFEDADSDPLTYTVKIGEADPVSADAAYSYTPTAEGTTGLVFTANDGTADSPTYTVTLTSSYCYVVTNNMTWAASSASTTEPYLKLSSVNTNYQVVYGSTQTFCVDNYAKLTNGMILTSVEIDGLVIPRSEFEAYTAYTEIDTSGCTHLNGRTVKIRMYNGKPYFQFAASTGYVTGNIEIKYLFNMPDYTPSVTIAESDAGKGTFTASFIGDTETGSQWTITPTTSSVELYCFDYLEDTLGNKTSGTDGTPIPIEIHAEGAAYTLHFADVAYPEAPEQDADGYYLLEDADDMRWFKKSVNGEGNYGMKVALAADIDMTGISWNGIGTCNNDASGPSFSGIFDGRGHTLTVAFTKGALFNSVSGTVKNLTVEGSVTLSGYGAGIISQLANGGNVDTCINKANISLPEGSTDKTDYAGGIVWAVYGNATITNCANYGGVKGGRYHNGGIVGCVRSSGYTVTISDCVNYADLDVGSDAWSAGGIVGSFTCDNGTVSDCTNYGNITAPDYAAGIVGELASDNSTIENCANYGNIVASNSFAGGITAKVGYFQCLIDGCSNAGAVTGKTYAGGIAGRNCCETTNCYNTGAITVTGDQSSYSAGGISGTQAKCQIYNTWTYTGGKISNCYTTGTVTKTNESSTIGAVVGVLSSTKTCTAYYLEGTCASGVGSISEDGTTDSTQAKTSEELKALAATLGDAFVSDTTNLNSGYPILAWQSSGSVTYGDVSGDGTIDSDDAVLILRYAAQLIDESGFTAPDAADVNGDGTIDSDDAVLILRYAAQLLTMEELQASHNSGS